MLESQVERGRQQTTCDELTAQLGRRLSAVNAGRGASRRALLLQLVLALLLVLLAPKGAPAQRPTCTHVAATSPSSATR